MGMRTLALLGMLAWLPVLILAGADYYRVLGVKRGANEAQIKRGYRK